MLKILNSKVEKINNIEENYRYKTVLVANLKQDDFYIKRFNQNGKVLIECKHKNIWDLNPRISMCGICPEAEGGRTNKVEVYSHEKDEIIEYIKKLGYYRQQNLNNLIKEPITIFTNEIIEGCWKLKDIEFIKTLEDVKKMNIIFATEYKDYWSDTDRIEHEYIMFYEYCNDCIKRHKMTLKYYYFQAWKGSGYCYNYRPLEGNTEKYDSIKRYLENIGVFIPCDTFKGIKELRRIEKIFDKLNLKFPVDINYSENCLIEEYREIEENNRKKREFGQKAFQESVKIFGKKETKKLLKRVNISTLDYITTLEKEKGEVKQYIIDQIKYALKYEAWKHFENVLGENFPCMRTFPDTKTGLEVWLEIV
ncbi:TPA: hypothetical protein PTV74_003303 [Clostridium botulinum]|nr:hypothetical protein [Clostridium botulinum]HDK7206458.1 hypothetical protein [Clostridium botulinum]HDK7210193.1 hypothetical protein [Clostridium botulinum]HDK7265643.1 hypothetical protein [Clostridium botulinum]HDK7269490.1 hypothetical protein [Clostridium botulinum]